MPSKRVLVVDDHEDSLDFVQEVLKAHFDVVVALGGAEALQLLEEQHFDALLLDLTMPAVDGFDVMAFVAARQPELPVLIASALPNVEKIAAELGAKDWVTKPYRAELLPQRLWRLCGTPGTSVRAPG